MQTYIRLFLNLLMPLTVLISVISIGYFTFDYDFSKAIKLGILAGVLLGIGVSLIMAMLLLILRAVQPQNTGKIEYIEEKEANTLDIGKTTAKEQIAIEKEIKCMLLMDKELTFNIILNTLKKNKEYALSASDPKKGTLSIETNEGIIQTSITSLTKHTSQIILQAHNNVKPIRNLISQLKEKETSFLQY